MRELHLSGQQPTEAGARYAARLAEYDDANAARRALLALDAGGMGSFQWDVQTGQVEGDAAWTELFGLSPRAAGVPTLTYRDVIGRIHPDDRDEVVAELQAALDDGEDYQAEFRVCRPGEAPQWVGGRGRVSERGPDGAPLCLLGVNWDLTELKRNEENLALLAKEMDHRVKNAFAVIRALVTIGMRSARDVRAFGETLVEQVQAMAEAHALSARLAREKAVPRAMVPVEDVLRSALAPWVEVGRDDSPVAIEIGEDAQVPPRQVSALAMLTYELATNAAKYGPLGERGGALTVRAVIEEREAPERGRELVLSWDEHCDPAEEDCAHVREAAEREAEHGVASGFGSILLTHCTGVLGASVRRELRPEGLLFELRVPLEGEADAEVR